MLHEFKTTNVTGGFIGVSEIRKWAKSELEVNVALSYLTVMRIFEQQDIVDEYRAQEKEIERNLYHCRAKL